MNVLCLSLFRTLAITAAICLTASLKAGATEPRNDGERAMLTTSNLLSKYIQSGDSNAIVELSNLVTNNLIGPNAAASLRVAISKARNDDVSRIIVPALIRGIQSSSIPIRRESAIAVKSGGKGGVKAIPALTELIRSDTSDARNFGIEALGALGPVASNCVPTLMQILHGPASADAGIGGRRREF